MLNDVLLKDFLEVVNRIPHPDLFKEDVIKLHFSDSKLVSFALSRGETNEAIGTLYTVTLKKAWSSSGVAWAFSD